MNRRTFVERSGALATLSLMGINSFAKPKQPIGLGLYTVRREMRKDPANTLKRISEIGYTHVESTGYKNGKFYRQEPQEFRKILSDNGLTMVSSHIGLHDIRKDPERLLEAGRLAGCDYMILGNLNPDQRTLEVYREVIERLNELINLSKLYRMRIGYHNHDFEFKPVDGLVPMELMLQEIEPYVPFEMDLYWVRKAGRDPVKLIQKYPFRFPLWHVKDMSANGGFTEVGNGEIDFQSIFNEVETAGLRYFFIEQDDTQLDPLESIEISYNNILKIE